MDSSLKLHVEVHGNKFDGEGPADIIQQAYQDWLTRLSTTAAAAPPPDPHASGFKDNPPAGPTDGLYKRVFVEKDGLVSLQALPQNQDDALVLLLHGYQRLKPDEYPVTAVRLM